MGRPHDVEVTPVGGGDLGHLQPFGGGNHRGVDRAAAALLRRAQPQLPLPAHRNREFQPGDRVAEDPAQPIRDPFPLAAGRGLWQVTGIRKDA